jgi:hypothetical protein
MLPPGTELGRDGLIHGNVVIRHSCSSRKPRPIIRRLSNLIRPHKSAHPQPRCGSCWVGRSVPTEIGGGAGYCPRVQAIFYRGHRPQNSSFMPHQARRRKRDVLAGPSRCIVPLGNNTEVAA